MEHLRHANARSKPGEFRLEERPRMAREKVKLCQNYQPTVDVYFNVFLFFAGYIMMSLTSLSVLLSQLPLQMLFFFFRRFFTGKISFFRMLIPFCFFVFLVFFVLSFFSSWKKFLLSVWPPRYPWWTGTAATLARYRHVEYWLITHAAVIFLPEPAPVP